MPSISTKMSQGCLQLGCPRPSTSEALFIQNEGLHVVGELVLYMLITAVAIVGCRAAAKYLGQILGTKEALKAPRNLVSPMEPGTLCFFYPVISLRCFIFLLTVLNIHSLQGKFREHQVFLWRTLEGSCTSGPGNLRKFGDQSWQLVVHVLMTAYVARLSLAVTVGQRFINSPCLWFNLSIGLHTYHTSMTWWETLQTFIPGNASSQQKWCPGFQSGAIFKCCYHVFEGFPCDLWRLQVGCGWPIPGHRENGKWLHIFGWQHWPVRTLWTQPWQSSFWTAINGDVNLFC